MQNNRTQKGKLFLFKYLYEHKQRPETKLSTRVLYNFGQCSFKFGRLFSQEDDSEWPTSTASTSIHELLYWSACVRVSVWCACIEWFYSYKKCSRANCQ